MDRLSGLGVRNSNAFLLMIFIRAKEFRPKIIKVNNSTVNNTLPNNEIAIIARASSLPCLAPGIKRLMITGAHNRHLILLFQF